MNIARAGGRLVLVVVAAGAIGVAGVQFSHAIASNIALGRELDQTQRAVDDLTARKKRDERAIARLQSAEGSLPEIHARLRVVGPHEELIYVRYTNAGGGAIEGPR